MSGTSHGDVMVLECASTCLDVAGAMRRLSGFSAGLKGGVTDKPVNVCMNPKAFFQDFVGKAFLQKYSGAGGADGEGRTEICYGRTRRFTATILLTVACTVQNVRDGDDRCEKMARWGTRRCFDFWYP